MLEKLKLEYTIFTRIQSSKKIFFTGLVVVLLSLSLLLNVLAEKPLLRGEESYRHLVSGLPIFGKNGNHIQWPAFQSAWFIHIITIVPGIMGVISTLLLIHVLERRKFSVDFAFLFVLLFILTPTFIYSYSTLSAYGLSFLLFLLGLVCWDSEQKIYRYASLIPFLYITTTDFLQSFLLGIILVYDYRSKKSQSQQSGGAFIMNQGDFYSQKWESKAAVERHGMNQFLGNRERHSEKKIILAVLLLTVLTQLLLLTLPLVIGPFHSPDRIRDLISDFGGSSGIGIFTILLSLIGLAIIPREKDKLLLGSLFLLAAAGYAYNTEAILPLTIVLIYFATRGFLALLNREWEIISISKITAFIIILGVFFSTITYVDRMSAIGPSFAEMESLSWIRENTAPESIVFSMVEDSYYVQFFAQRKTLLSPDTKNAQKQQDYQAIKQAQYIEQLFPVLEKNNITLLYISPSLRKQLPADQGLLFLLQNERFKLVHSQEETEVWQFKKDDTGH